MYGHIYSMAQVVAEGIDSVDDTHAESRRVPETLPENVLEQMGAVEARRKLARDLNPKPTPSDEEIQIMSNRSDIDPVRRRTLLGALAAVASVPLANLVMSARLEAEELPHLSKDDPTAKALNYHNDASAAPRVDKPGTPAAEQFCHNCRFIQSDSGDWRPCQIFPGKAVNANGWCSSWTKQTA